MENSPARIFVLWHPKFTLGTKIAREIFNWFRTSHAYGIPVYYRSDSSQQGNDGLPPIIPFDRDCITFLVVLAEVQMVRDPVWRHWLSALANQNAKGTETNRPGEKPKQGLFNRPIILPVALHKTAYNLPSAIQRLNYISPLAKGGRDGDLENLELESIVDPLRKSLTEDLARTLGHDLSTSKGKKFATNVAAMFFSQLKNRPKIKIFLSHAKRDAEGVEAAKQLRDYIYQKTQLSAFFDENDIAYGDKFSKVLNDSLKRESAAMIVVNSDQYAKRPWCRREIQVFSQPRRSSVAVNVWEKSPLLIVQAMVGKYMSSSVPEFGNAPMLRWQDGHAQLCIDSLLREAIFRVYHSTFASKLLTKAHGEDDERIYINWRPDPLSLNIAVREAREPPKTDKGKYKFKPNAAKQVVYPGVQLSSIELQSFNEYFSRNKSAQF